MSKDVIDKFATIKIRNKLLSIIEEKCQKNNIGYSDFLNNAVGFYCQHKLYEEFAKSPANELLSQFFRLNGELFEQLKLQVEKTEKTNNAKFNSMEEIVGKLIHEVQILRDYIQDINKFLIEILGGK
ncbi:MAG: hypothetical protein LBC44_00585 [Mycoplasmataceae bacterium]|jgi:hypothetical protein|nr:hypothetical protein [Mycoplasmataceae bacterium]